MRSEKDPFTLMRLIDVNIYATRRTLDWAGRTGAKKYFCVSTDKAANPVNMMGGSKRIMEVTWTGKIKDKGPSFRVKNNSKLEVLYGNLFVYFYDKAGKQIQVGEEGKKKPYRTCRGRIFAGALKPGEKATIYFSCVKKKDVPEGAKAIEGEIKTVGFTDKSGKRTDTYWQNADLVPKERPTKTNVQSRAGWWRNSI